jgi:hypothetical protein
LIADQAPELRKRQILIVGAHCSCWTVEQRELIKPANLSTASIVIVG